MPKAIFEFSEVCSKLNKRLKFWLVSSNLFWIVTIWIQTRCAMNHIGKEKTIISLKDWKIAMFDYK